MWMFSVPLVAALTLLAVAYTAFRASQTARTPQGAVGWVVFLVALPFVAVPAYYVFGYARISRFRDRWKVVRVSPETWSRPQGLPKSSAASERLAPFTAIGGGPVVAGCGRTVLRDSEETYDPIFDAIAEARHYVLVQFYIIRDDETGRRLHAALCDAVARGVRVHLLYDPLGCLLLTRRYRRTLAEAGVQMYPTRGPSRLLGRFALNYRNHRKCVVVDGRTGFTGGLNVANEYAGAWRDTHIRLTGPVVSQLQAIFADDWAMQAHEQLDGLLWDTDHDSQGTHALMIGSGPIDGHEIGTLYFTALCQVARRRLWLTTPYFVPTADLLSALKLAALRGVEIRILVPHVYDKLTPWIAAFAYFDEVRDAGVQILRYTPCFMHQKVALVDDDIVSIGTLNMDIRSCILNFEETAVFYGEDQAREVEEMLRQDMEHAYVMTNRLDEQPLWLRVAAPVFKLLAPLL
ncbi:cardiolipin synthase [Tranquillimonas alkanivorans]|uniref:Cardiolipin synthase n=1 Tax=Tranquillimonas alkanivorans TaxID=441119 RepID=A0A1I5LDF9_9RHOB|nr:cardiolipin synthase [Tranquillimonas alkanivorans]SFO95213.1 cardiolipin synthase [Tranquillimonas alkanivorans]